MKRALITIALGTLIFFIWNAISWMALPFHSASLNNIPDEAMDVQKLKNQLPSDGVYHYPGLPEGENARHMDEIQSRLVAGPRITLMVVKKGKTSFFDPMSFVFNLIYNLLTVICSYILLARLENKTFNRVFTSTILIGVIVALVSDLPSMNWYMFPLDYTLANLLDRLIAFSLLGLLFGAYAFRTQNT